MVPRRLVGETLVPPGPVPYCHVLELAEKLDLHVNDVVARLRRYGFDLHLRVPDNLTDVERTLFRPEGEWWYLYNDDVMPVAYLVVAAHRLHIPPSEVEALIRSYGVETACSDLPRGLTFDRALRLLTLDKSDDVYLERDWRFSLHWLIGRARDERVSIAQVVDWLREIGIQVVPDLGHTVRSALARVPRAEPTTGPVPRRHSPADESR